MRLSPAQSLRFCGRQFSPAELDRLRHWLAEGQCHRSELARRAGAEFGWVNGAGQLKLMSCRVALLRMERAGLLRLPLPQKRNGNGRRSPLAAPAALELLPPPFTTPASQLPGLRLDVVQTPVQAALYRQLLDRYRPVLLESFVEKDRFEGTCYKAANWRRLGLTKGRGKLEKTGQTVLPVKWVFIYPLCSDFMEQLKR